MSGEANIVVLDLGDNGPSFLAANLCKVAESHEADGWPQTGASLRDLAAQASGQATVARPLVVIDPEDREAVERLMRVVRDQTFSAGDTYPGMGKFADGMQAALREFASPTPPKPDEPMGLGAVVEDHRGDKWLHGYGGWTCKSAWSEWNDISAVRVLSEGVPA